jgi:NAD(P)-dependent dehydrogenase (short-subunit alcohol dehydrogenase family)
MPSTTSPLADLTALVTGATTGLGRAIALRLAADGATVLLHGRDPERGAKVVAEIAAAGGDARFIAADLTDVAAITHLAEAAGDVDILVNNAGLSWFGPTPELEVETFDALFNANVRGTYLLTAALAPAMAIRGSGSVINVSSMVGEIGLSGAAAYGATKAAVSALARHWAVEYGERGVRFNAIAPGPVKTRPEAADFFDELGATTPLGRAAEPDEIAAAVAYLAAPSSSYVTGSTLAIDGGRVAV